MYAINSLLKICLLIIALSMLGCSKPERVRLAEVIVDLPQHKNEKIEIEACLVSGTHGMFLADCSDDSIGLSFDFDNGVEGTPGAKELLDAGYESWAPGPKAKIRVVASGRLVSAANQRTGVKLMIDAVTKVDVAN